MDSRTKRRLSPAQLDALALDALGAGVVSARELPDGFANAVWRLRLEDGREVILKVGPPPGLELLTYERDLLRTEAMVYHLATAAGLPLPALLHAGYDDPLVGGDYLILSALDGVPWNRAALTPEQDGGLRFQLGRHLALLHTIPGDGVFGYPYAGLTGRSWREAFLVMAGAILDDAVRYATPLPAPPLEIAGLFHGTAYALDRVTRPALVHFDVWPGNVFLSGLGSDAPGGGAGGMPRIQALIDHERAFWGDPLADFVTPTLFGELRDGDPLIAGYRDAGGVVAADPEARIRDALYRAYLYLIMLAENGPRQYPEESYAPVRARTTECLALALDVLRGVVRGGTGAP
ncbi:phosphotransferase family protein [Microtetraspora niveoalba]|uniref:phosphotransferase family protein n=1 Tax=Microtetraspora niveoalba TaxID=46175 RepID=UPI00082D2023|nr:phosphotransferase [Microtetraspora niveoalba]